MSLADKLCFSFLCVMVLLPVLCHSHGGYTNYVPSRATYYRTHDGQGTPTGACGFGEYGKIVNNGSVSAVSSRLFNNGVGCGACYQVRCKVPQYCTKEGTKVVVTDNGEGDRTDFIMSVRGFAGMARPKLASKLFSYGTVDVEYQRIPCYYPNYDVQIKIHENSRYPEYISIVLLYVGGQNDITAVEVLQREGYRKWVPMRRAYGAVWDLPNPPKGPLFLRVKVTGSFANGKWLSLRDVIPSDWKVGAVYDTNFKLN